MQPLAKILAPMHHYYLAGQYALTSPLKPAPFCKLSGCLCSINKFATSLPFSSSQTLALFLVHFSPLAPSFSFSSSQTLALFLMHFPLLSHFSFLFPLSDSCSVLGTHFSSQPLLFSFPPLRLLLCSWCIFLSSVLSSSYTLWQLWPKLLFLSSYSYVTTKFFKKHKSCA